MVQRSLTSIVKRIEGQLDNVKTIFLQKIATTLVSFSPVDTGAYVTSHSITDRSGNGRSRTSHGKSKRQDKTAKGVEALTQLMGDIAALSKNETKTYIANRSPHSKYVENGSPTIDARLVYTQTRLMAPTLLAAAIQEAKQ